jgi:membrane protease YdiL (CAAX protease family)
MSDSDPPPSSPPPSARSVRPMPVFLAGGWLLGVLFTQNLLLLLVLSARHADQADLVSGFACQAAAFLLGLFLILRVHAPEAGVREFIGARKTHPAFYPLGVVLGAAIVFPADALFELIQRRYPDPRDANASERISEMLSRASPPMLVVLGVILVLIGPVLEEVFFRSALQKPLERSYPASRSIAVGITAVLFAFAHRDLQELIPLALLGLMLGFLRQQSGSIIPSSLLHITFNAISFYSSLAAPHGAGVTAEPIPRWMIAAGAGAALSLLALAHVLGTRTEAAARAQELDRQ